MNDDIASPGFQSDPHAFFRRLREADPVHWSEPSRAWLITSYEAVVQGFKDDRALSSDRISRIEARIAPERRAEMAGTFELLRGWMVFRDEPVHQTLREPVRRVFTPRRVAALAPRIRAIVDGLLDAMEKQEACDLREAFAFPLPAIVIAELLGIPAADRDRFAAWSWKLAHLVFGAVESEGRNAAAREGAAEFTAYFEELVRRREREPGDDLVSALVAAREDDALAPELVVGACTLLLFGGHETTASLIANGVATLLEHPQACARLRSDPAVAETAVEELLRFEGPAAAMVRVVREDHQRCGRHLRAGDRVFLCIAAANRDPVVFADPDRLDLGRQPNAHLGFGHGRHFCLGAALARLETRIAISRLLERFPRLSLTAPPRWATSRIGRGVDLPPLRLH